MKKKKTDSLQKNQRVSGAEHSIPLSGLQNRYNDKGHKYKSKGHEYKQ